MADFGRLHRYELSGVTAGLTRVRTFSQDDAHIFTPFEKVEAEIFAFLEFLDFVYGAFGFEDVEISLGLRPEKRIGADAFWDRGEAALEAALKAAGRPFVVTPGDGAFYGPKIDFRVKDAIGRPWQLGTIQCDFAQPENFDLTYIGEDGKPHRPVVLHRAILGSLERFLGILIEHTAGNFPFWIAPVQAVRPAGLRPVRGGRPRGRRAPPGGGAARRDGRPQREARAPGSGRRSCRRPRACSSSGRRRRPPGRVSVRLRHGGDAGTMSVDQFVAAARAAIEGRQRELSAEVKDR